MSGSKLLINAAQKPVHKYKCLWICSLCKSLNVITREMFASTAYICMTCVCVCCMCVMCSRYTQYVCTGVCRRATVNTSLPAWILLGPSHCGRHLPHPVGGPGGCAGHHHPLVRALPEAQWAEETRHVCGHSDLDPTAVLWDVGYHSHPERGGLCCLHTHLTHTRPPTWLTHAHPLDSQSHTTESCKALADFSVTVRCPAEDTCEMGLWSRVLPNYYTISLRYIYINEYISSTMDAHQRKFPCRCGCGYNVCELLYCIP